MNIGLITFGMTELTIIGHLGDIINTNWKMLRQIYS